MNSIWQIDFKTARVHVETAGLKSWLLNMGGSVINTYFDNRGTKPRTIGWDVDIDIGKVSTVERKLKVQCDRSVSSTTPGILQVSESLVNRLLSRRSPDDPILSLDTAIDLNGTAYSLIKRNRHVALFELTQAPPPAGHDNRAPAVPTEDLGRQAQVVGYDVVILPLVKRKREDRTIYEERMPTLEEYGSLAWSHNTLPAAELQYSAVADRVEQIMNGKKK